MFFLTLIILTIFSISFFFLSLESDKKFHNHVKKMIQISSQSLTVSLPHHQPVPDSSLLTIENNPISISELANDKPLCLLVVNTQCSACSLDIQDFAAESLAVGDYYNFILIVDPNSNNKSIPINHNFSNILYSNENFIKEFRISLFPSFFLINKELMLVATPPMTNKFNQYYKQEHKLLSTF